MRQMSPMSQVHTHNGIAVFDKCKIGCDIGLRTGMRLYIGMIGLKQLGYPIACQIFHHINIFTAAIIAFGRVALGIFVGHGLSHGLQHGSAGKIF